MTNELFCCWDIMNDTQDLGLVTDSLDKAREFKKNNPNYDSIYSIKLNVPVKQVKDEDGDELIWGTYVE